MTAVLIGGLIGHGICDAVVSASEYQADGRPELEVLRQLELESFKSGMAHASDICKQWQDAKGDAYLPDFHLSVHDAINYFRDKLTKLP